MPQSKEQKRKNAVKLVEDRKTRTPEQQLEILDQRLGKGKGATKERMKLQNQINPIDSPSTRRGKNKK